MQKFGVILGIIVYLLGSLWWLGVGIVAILLNSSNVTDLQLVKELLIVLVYVLPIIIIPGLLMVWSGSNKKWKIFYFSSLLPLLIIITPTLAVIFRY